jgi:hypothetical protein
MNEHVAVDTDVILKVAGYSVAEEAAAVLGRTAPPAALGLTHLIAHKQLSKRRGVVDREAALAALRTLLGLLGSLEPSADEVALAADLAARAQAEDLPLDTGEAQLTAITLKRALPLLVSGDKRALAALAALFPAGEERAALQGRMMCFEQLIAALAREVGEEELRARICREPGMDTAMRLACSCGNESWTAAQLHEACESYIEGIRRVAGDLLV